MSSPSRSHNVISVTWRRWHFECSCCYNTNNWMLIKTKWIPPPPPKNRAQYFMKSICNIIFPLHERFSISEALFLTNFSVRAKTIHLSENDPIRCRITLVYAWAKWGFLKSSCDGLQLYPAFNMQQASPKCTHIKNALPLNTHAEVWVFSNLNVFEY